MGPVAGRGAGSGRGYLGSCFVAHSCMSSASDFRVPSPSRHLASSTAAPLRATGVDLLRNAEMLAFLEGGGRAAGFPPLAGASCFRFRGLRRVATGSIAAVRCLEPERPLSSSSTAFPSSGASHDSDGVAPSAGERVSAKPFAPICRASCLAVGFLVFFFLRYPLVQWHDIHTFLSLIRNSWKSSIIIMHGFMVSSWLSS